MPKPHILTKLLGKPEEINGANRCPTYLYRWKVWKAKKSGRAVYIHHFVGDDWSLDLHDHPKWVIVIGIRGSYIETTGTTVDGDPPKYELFRAPWIRAFQPEHRHRIETPTRWVRGWSEWYQVHSCWTICIVLKTRREWGFWHRGYWYPWRDYVNGKNSALADSMKSCPD